MKHEDNHKLDVACLDCIREHIRVKEKLIIFVRKVRDGFFFNQTDEEALKMLYESEELLKELGDRWLKDNS